MAFSFTKDDGQPYVKSQGCSTLFAVVHIAQGFEASEGSGVAILGDGVGLIEPQDIISESNSSSRNSKNRLA